MRILFRRRFIFAQLGFVTHEAEHGTRLEEEPEGALYVNDVKERNVW